MIGKYKLLLKMQMYHLFGINRLLHSHNQKEKVSLLAIGVAGILLVGILLFMSCGVPRSTIGNIVNCQYDSVKLRVIHELCQGLNLDISEFFNSDLFREENLEP